MVNDSKNIPSFSKRKTSLTGFAELENSEPFNNNNEKRAKNSVRVLFSFGLINPLLSILSFTLLGRLILPEEFGLFVICMGIVGLTDAFCRAGFSETIIGLNATSEHFENQVFTASVLISLSLVVCSIMIVYAISLFSGFSSSLTLFLLCLSKIVTTPFLVVYHGKLMRNFQHGLWVRSQLFAAVFSLLLALIAAYFGAGAFALALRVLVDIFLLTAFLGWSLRSVPRFARFPIPSRDQIFFNANLTSEKFIINLNENVPSFLVGWSISSYGAGLMNFGKRLQHLVNSVSSTVAKQVTLPLFFGALENGNSERVNRLVLSTLRATLAVAFATFPLLLLFPEKIISFLGGDNWQSAAMCVRAYAIFGLAATLNHLFPNLFVTTGHTKFNSGNSLVELLMKCTAMLALSPFGIEGMAWGLAISEIARTPILLTWLKRTNLLMNGTRIWLHTLMPVLLASATASIVATLAAVPGSSLAVFLSINCSIYLAVYSVILFKLSPETLHLLFSLFRDGASKPVSSDTSTDRRAG